MTSKLQLIQSKLRGIDGRIDKSNNYNLLLDEIEDLLVLLFGEDIPNSKEEIEAARMINCLFNYYYLGTVVEGAARISALGTNFDQLSRFVVQLESIHKNNPFDLCIILLTFIFNRSLKKSNLFFELKGTYLLSLLAVKQYSKFNLATESLSLDEKNSIYIQFSINVSSLLHGGAFEQVRILFYF
jgi:hypothetical protein